MSALRVPDISPDDDTLGAALKYATCGWYVLPVKAGAKDPGSVVRHGWQHQSSRDPHVLAGWFAGTDYGLALHVGRSGAVAADVDDPDALPDALRRATSNGAPHQSTRANHPGRGHYLFTQPPGRNIGNSSGSLGKSWGEVRGKNGVIIVAPSVHALAAHGGRYQWVSTGPVPVLPAEVAAALPEAAEAVDAATDAEVEAFLDAHTSSSRPELLDVWCALFANDVEAGASRHTSMVSKLAGAMKEAAAGLLDARTAADTLESLFLAAVSREGTAKQGPARDGATARNEWAGLLAWAVAQAKAADPEQTRARAASKVPSADYYTDTDTDTGEVPGASQDGSGATQDDPGERARRLFPRLDWHALWGDDEEEEWIHQPLLPARRSVVIYSPPKAGKSLLMLELAVAISRGETFLGYTPTRRWRVLYVDYENDPRGDVRGRLQAMGYGPDDLDHVDYLSFPRMAGLDTERGSLELLEAVSAYGSEVVVIDTVSRAVDGDENSNDTWLGLYRHTGLKLKRAGVAAVRLDHTGKDESKGQRGGSAKSGDVDAIWKLTKITDTRFRLECTGGLSHISSTADVTPLL